MTILIVEDDERIIEFVRRGLEAEGYNIDIARDGKEAITIATSPIYKLIILDLMLPFMNGQEVCQHLRGTGVKTPILMLTAMNTTDDKVQGLRMGADDYLSKPFAFDELLARIEALLRRGINYKTDNASRELRVGDLVLNHQTKEVTRSGKTISLTPKEYALLETFMNYPGQVFSRTRLLENVWGYNADPMTNVVEVYIRGLRRKIDENFDKPVIITVRGFGYKLDTN